MEQDFIIVCESAIIAEGSKNLYILGMFDKANVSSFPVVHPKFVVVTRYRGGTGEHAHAIALRHKDGEELVRLEGKITFGSNGKAQYIGTFIGVLFPKAGTYTLESYIDGTRQLRTGELEISLNS